MHWNMLFKIRKNKYPITTSQDYHHIIKQQSKLCTLAYKEDTSQLIWKLSNPKHEVNYCNKHTTLIILMCDKLSIYSNTRITINMEYNKAWKVISMTCLGLSIPQLQQLDKVDMTSRHVWSSQEIRDYATNTILLITMT